MASSKQIEANRLNARKSTGPRSTQGKSATRLNALKHGLFATDPIIPGEDPARFDALRTSHDQRFQPATPDEQILVAALVRSAWFLERYSAVETQMWNAQLESNSRSGNPQTAGPKYSLAAAHAVLCQDLSRVQRRLDSAERNYRRDLELLIKLQTARRRPLPRLKPFGKPRLLNHLPQKLAWFRHFLHTSSQSLGRPTKSARTPSTYEPFSRQTKVQ